MNMIRTLRADEVEVRIGTVSEKGVSLLLYKDARVDQNILDEVFGPLGWKRSHTAIGDSIYCTVEVYDPDKKQWVGKQDVGSSGQMEKEKSSASDSFKRSCFNWGIGRELYTAPFIWIPSDQVEIVKRGDRCMCFERFSVRSIAYNDKREICSLEIQNARGKCVYHFTTEKTVSRNIDSTSISDEQRLALAKELQRTGVPKSEVYKRFHIASDQELTDQLYARIMMALERTRSAGSAA